MKQTFSRILIITAAVVLAATPSMVSAQESDDSSSDMTTSEPRVADEKADEARRKLHARLEAQKAARQEKADAARAHLQERLEGAKKRACENRRDTINRLMNGMNERRQRAFDRVSQISQAIQDFYAKEQLSAQDYDSLVAAVEVARDAASSTLDVQLSAPELDCDGDHPRADMAEFKEERLASIDAMREYRDAVKALGQAVKDAAAAARGESQ